MGSAPPDVDPLALAPDVSIVVNTHREGVLAHPTFRSLARACRAAVDTGIRVEVVVVLDRADEATRSYVDSLETEQVFEPPTEVRVLEVDHGDLGLSRNAGMRLARGSVAGVLDADNLVGANWLVAGVAAVRADPDAVVHPEIVVSFGERRTLWPSINTDDPRFRPELLRSHNYWDAFSLARRSTYLRVPWAASGPGWGPEDWHWNIETVAAGTRHVVARHTALFYRAKGADSLLRQHEASGHLVAPAALLVSADLARAALEERRSSSSSSPSGSARRPSDVSAVLGRAMAAPAEAYADIATPLAEYRLLHPDLRAMDDDQLAQHWESFGRAEGRRHRLGDEEAAALARWRPEHYLLLNPDLVGLTDDDLLGHFLEHGMREGRRGWVTPEELTQAARLQVSDYLLANPDLEGFTPEQAIAHFIQHGADRPTRVPFDTSQAPAWLLGLWRDASRLEPDLPTPTSDVLTSYRFFGDAPDVRPPASFSVWWEAVARLDLDPANPTVLLLADHLDEDGLADHLRAVSCLDPAPTPYVLVTGERRAGRDGSDGLDGLDELEGVRVVRLRDIAAWESLDRYDRARLLAELVVQLGPTVTHLWGRGPAFDAFAWHGIAMSQRSVVHLTVDGEGLADDLSHPLVGRPPGFLDRAAVVWVDDRGTTERLWEVSRLPRGMFAPRARAGGLVGVLAASPGYGSPDLPMPDPLHASPETAELLAGTTPVALVITGYEGFANFGDIIQAKNLSRYWRARGVHPVHVVSAGAVRTRDDVEACRRDTGSSHVLLRGWGADGPPAELGLVRVRDVTPDGILHIGGGGYLNRHWHRQRMRDVWSVRVLARPRALLVSGVQVDDSVRAPLGDLFATLPPVIMGARDERSRSVLERACPDVSARASFDDATEMIVDWAAADEGPAPDEGPHAGTRIGIHLNTSDYAADRSVLAVVNDALAQVRSRDPQARLTVLHAYDDDRAEVADSLESLPRLRAQFVFDRFDVVDLARAARTLDLDGEAHPGSREVPTLAPLRRLDLAIVASYHCAVLLGLLGVPTHLLVTNSFYDDKAAGLGQTASLEEFLSDPRRHGIDLGRAREVRRAWLRDLEAAVDGSGMTAPRGPTR